MLLLAWKMTFREERRLTEEYFFDTDCLSAFLWVREESILARLYAGKIILPMQVYKEIQKVPHLRERVDALKNCGHLRVERMDVESEEYSDYLHMTTAPEKGMKIIGMGEAAGIAMAKYRNGTLASNNLRDVLPYIEKYEISHITTGDILVAAMDAGIISGSDGDAIWSDMIKKRRMLPTKTFSEYLTRHEGQGEPNT